jgi:hypothetical protein
MRQSFPSRSMTLIASSLMIIANSCGGTTSSESSQAGDGGRSSHFGGQGGDVAGNQAAGSSSAIEVGISCSPVGALGCASTGASRVLFCRTDGTWAVKEVCGTGLHCQGGSGPDKGTCIASPPEPTPDPNCMGMTAPFCANGHKYECNSAGAITYSSVCPSRTCDGSSCLTWNPCVTHSADISAATPSINQWCIPECVDGYPSQLCTYSITSKISSGTELPANYLSQDNRATGPWDIAIPGSATWPPVEQCPDLRTYALFSTALWPVQFEVPEPYWVVVVDATGAARALACDGLPQAMPVQVNFRASVAYIVTRDPKAPPFWLSVESLYGQTI